MPCQYPVMKFLLGATGIGGGGFIFSKVSSWVHLLADCRRQQRFLLQVHRRAWPALSSAHPLSLLQWQRG